MNHCFELSGETGILAVGEALTIEDAAELKTAIADAFAATIHLYIDLSQVKEIDLCCLQLFCSAHRTAVSAGKTLALRNAGEGFGESSRNAGYLRHVGCMPDVGHDCLWIDITAEKTGVKE